MKTVTQTPIFWKRFSWWWLYFYDSLSEVHVEFGQSLREALKQYVASTGVSIPVYDPAACVVHYRLGDVLDPNYQTLAPDSMARELYRWSILKNLTIREFHVLGGGNILHNTGDQNRITISQRMLLHLCRTLQGLFLNVTVYVDVSGQPDEDFMKLVSAPILFTSHGSYATAALLANTGQKASPACSNLNFPGHGQLEARDLAPGWYIYRYELANLSHFQNQTSNSTWEIPGR